MNEKPRSRDSFIINRAMSWRIIGVGGVFFLFLICLVWIFEHSTVNSISDLLHVQIGAKNGLSSYELSLFFTIFVMLQFWNMFNARAFDTGASAFHFKDCGGFVVIAVIILAGQILIINVGTEFFNVVPISFADWIVIIFGTSIVLWIGEIARFMGNKAGSHATI